MTGRHNLMNALAASAVATALQIKPELIANALRTAKPPRMRGEVLDFAQASRSLMIRITRIRVHCLAWCRRWRTRVRKCSAGL